MKNIFDQDGAVMKYGDLAVNLFCASVIWLLTSAPVLTLGASLPALFETVHLTVREGKGYVSRTYFRAFLKYFKKGMKRWLLQICILAVLGVDLWYFRKAMIDGRTEGMFLIPVFLLAVFAIGWVLLCAYFHTKKEFEQIGFKESLILCAGKMHWTLSVSLLFLGASVLMYIIPILALWGPGLLFLWFDTMLEKKSFRMEEK